MPLATASYAMFWQLRCYTLEFCGELSNLGFQNSPHTNPVPKRSNNIGQKSKNSYLLFLPELLQFASIIKL